MFQKTHILHPDLEVRHVGLEVLCHLVSLEQDTYRRGGEQEVAPVSVEAMLHHW